MPRERPRLGTLRPERAPGRSGDAVVLPDVEMTRRVILVPGTRPADDVGPGDLAVLDRRVLGRQSLRRLAEDLARRGAAGLVVSEETVARLSPDLRGSIEEHVPLVVVGSEWERLRSRLHDAGPGPAGSDPDTALRAILHGRRLGGPLPAGIHPSRTAQALVLVAGPGGDLPRSRLEEIAATEAQLANPRAHVLPVDGVVAIISNQPGRGRDAEAIGRAILRRSTPSEPELVPTVGVGRPYVGPAGLRRSFREAKWAATAGEMLWGGGRVVSFRELGIYGLLEPFVRDPSTGDTQDVEKLLEHDRRNDTALVPTVEAYFDSGRRGDAAAGLFVHRNTVAYRLRAVRRITGLDVVDDPEARLLLEVQIRLARLWGILPRAPVKRAVRRSPRSER